MKNKINKIAAGYYEGVREDGLKFEIDFSDERAVGYRWALVAVREVKYRAFCHDTLIYSYNTKKEALSAAYAADPACWKS